MQTRVPAVNRVIVDDHSHSLVWDDFLGPDGELSAHAVPIDVGAAGWVEASGDWEIVDEKAEGHTNSVTQLAIIETNQADVIVEAGITRRDANNVNNQRALAFRAADSSNYWTFRHLNWSGAPNTLQMWQTVAGGDSQQGGASVAYTIAVGDSHVFRAVLSGSSIKCYLDGALKFDFTDTDLQANTMHGLWKFSNVHNGFDDFDYFRVWTS